MKGLENPVPASGRDDIQTAMPEVGGNDNAPSNGGSGSQMKLAAPKGAGAGGSVPASGSGRPNKPGSDGTPVSGDTIGMFAT